MTYYIFRARVGNEMAITDDHTGAKLPKRTGAWVYDRPIEISADRPRIGASSSEIIDAVERVGYFILPKTDIRRPHQ
jgi:hypothetical protein